MENLFFTSMLFILCGFPGNQQINDAKTIPLNHIRTVVVVGGDQLIINRSSSEDLKVKSYLFASGKVIGFGSQKKRPAFTINNRISGDTLFLHTPDKFSPVVVGIKTYNEKIETTIDLPPTIELLIGKSNRIQMDGIFPQTHVLDSKFTSISGIYKNEIGRMNCRAMNKLVLNGSERSKDLEILGAGNNILSIYSEDINLIIHDY